MTTPADWYAKDMQSRVHPSHRRRVATPDGEMDIVYCLSCHKPHGLVFPETPSILVICPPCAGRWGGLPLPKLTDEDLERIGLSHLKEG